MVAGIIIIFRVLDIMAEMRTKVTQLVRVGGVIPGSPPSAARPFLSHPHLARTPRLLVRLGYEIDQQESSCFRGNLRIILGGPGANSYGARGMKLLFAGPYGYVSSLLCLLSP